jgi:hypothetical protein
MECGVRKGGSFQPMGCVGVGSGGAECSRAKLGAVDEEMVQPLHNVQVELCQGACCVESCFRDEFVGRVIAEGEKGGKTGDCECVRCTCEAHDYAKNVDGGTWQVLSNGVGKGKNLSRRSCAVWERLWYVQYFHSPI